ncbi:NAD(P)H-binding protein [bacterium]|nr:NAD(P)H-binding protein [bacterium]
MEDNLKPAVLVTGASGFIGGKLVSKMAAECRSVVSMYRQRLPEPIENVFPVCNDLRSSELLGAPLREIDTVVHLAWENDSLDRPQKNNSINLFLLRNLISKMEEVGTRRLVLLSHAGVSSVSHETFLKDKYEMENLALNSSIDEVVIVRSPIVMSGVPGEDKYLDAMLNLFKLPMFYPVPISKDRKFGVVSLEEVTDLISERTLGKVEFGREVVELKSAQDFSLEQILKYICQKYVKKQKLGLGAFVGKSLARVMNRVSSKGSISINEIEAIGLLAKSGVVESRDNFITSKLMNLEEILVTEKLRKKTV